MKKIALILGLIVVLLVVNVATATFTAPEATEISVSQDIASLGLSEADIVALEWDCKDAQEWIDNVVAEKIRHTKEDMVMETLQDNSALSKDDLATVASMLSGVLVLSAEDIPENVQDYIVLHSLLPSAKDIVPMEF